MSKAAYLYTEYIKNLAAASIALTSEDSTNYPKTNLQNEQVALTTRTTAKVDIKLQFDLGSALSPQTFGILNHNFSGGTYDINSYTAADYTTGKTAVEESKAIRLLDTWHRETAAPTARQYWELDFTNTTSAAAYFEFGRVMVYSDVTQITAIEDAVVPRGYGFRNIVNVTPYGVRWVHKLTQQQERFQLTWNERAIADAVHTELRMLYSATNGGASPFLYIPDITGAACYYVYLESPELAYQEICGLTSGHIGNVSIGLIEAVRGKA